MSQNQLYNLLDVLTEELFSKSHSLVVKKLVTRVGDQENSDVCIISPKMAVKSDGIPVDMESVPYIWIPSWPGSPPAQMTRHFAAPPSLDPLKKFIDLASDITGNNFVPNLLALSSMLMMANYREILSKLGHFNLPVLYGSPKVGKTLAAQCAGLFSGLPMDDSLTSRDTQSFLSQSFSSSTLPFVWDDPTSRAEVKQVAVDLANGAARGKSNGRDIPQTACLVTANFDLKEEEKYHTRLFVVPFKALTANPSPGVYAKMTESARASSSAFLQLARQMREITVDAINQQTTYILSVIPDIDIRVAEGISLPTLICKKMLEAVRGEHYIGDLTTFIEDDLAGYHRGIASAKLPAADLDNLLLRMKDMDNLSHCLRIASDCLIMDKALAASFLSIETTTVIMAIRKIPGAVINKAGRLQGKVKKVAKIPLETIPQETLVTLGLVAPELEKSLSEDLPPPPPPLCDFMNMSIDDDTDLPLPPPPPEYGLEPLIEVSTACFPPPPEWDCVGMQEEEVHVDECLTISLSPLQEVNLVSTPSSTPSPGKPDQENCTKCGKKGRKGLRWIQCDECENWWHKKCTQLSDRDYKIFVNDNDKKWFCCH